MENFRALEAEAGAFHGHLCPGISIGVRMTLAGLKAVGIADATGADRKKLIVFTEIDRCASDAIMCLTGCRPGKRSMKVMDYGKMAATFINLETGKAVRLAAVPRDPNEDQSKWDFGAIPDGKIFSVSEVEVTLSPCDLPGKPVSQALCARCGETVLDGREVQVGNETVCKPCAGGKDYYRRKPRG
jgi:formylmethanofuran dehydrogenase subunit E